MQREARTFSASVSDQNIRLFAPAANNGFATGFHKRTGKARHRPRLRKETTLRIKQIAARVHPGTFPGANANLHRFIVYASGFSFPQPDFPLRKPSGNVGASD